MHPDGQLVTHRDKPTLFQMHLECQRIHHKLIRFFTPRHNDKVECSQRKNNERFYATHRFYSFEDFAKQLKRYNYRNYNTISDLKRKVICVLNQVFPEYQTIFSNILGKTSKEVLLHFLRQLILRRFHPKP